MSFEEITLIPIINRDYLRDIVEEDDLNLR